MWAWTCPIWASPGWGCSACSWRGEVLVTGPLCGSRWAAQWCELLPWTKRNFEWMTSHCDRSNWILKTHLAFLRIQWDSTGHISEYYIFNFPSQERSKKKSCIKFDTFHQYVESDISSGGWQLESGLCYNTEMLPMGALSFNAFINILRPMLSCRDIP